MHTDLNETEESLAGELQRVIDAFPLPAGLCSKETHEISGTFLGRYAVRASVEIWCERKYNRYGSDELVRRQRVRRLSLKKDADVVNISISALTAALARSGPF